MIVIIATLDTKGEKVRYLNQIIKKNGVETLVIDCGILGKPSMQADIPREAVARVAGARLERIAALGDEDRAMRVMAAGASTILADLHSRGEIGGLVGIGGTMGTALFMSAARVLPIGTPKVVCTTLSFQYMQVEMVPPDVMVVPAVSDIFGLNSLNKRMNRKHRRSYSGCSQSA